MRARVFKLRQLHHQRPDLSYPELGRIFGIHHSTVLYWLGGRERRAIKKGRYWIDPFLPPEELPF